MKRAFLALIVLLIICNIYGGAALADGNQTAQQKADSIHILDADGNDLTIKSSTLTIHVGEMTTLQAVVDPTDTQDGTVEWTCSDSAGKTLRMINTANDTVIIACISTEYKNLRVTASSNGVSATITVNVKPAIEKKDEASDAFTQWSSTDIPFAVIYRYENEEWFLVTKEQMTIGRLGDIQINDFDRHISRIHALIFYEEGKF